MAESENLATATGTFRLRLPVLMYNTLFVMSQNCKMQGCQWYGVKRIKSIFPKKGNVGKGFEHHFITSSSSHVFNKTDF